jgi:hypothetical protein
MSVRGSPQNTSDSPDQPADADRGGHVPDCFTSRIENAEREDDDQHVEATAHERLSDHQRDEQTRSRRARNRPEPRREQRAHAAVSASAGEVDAAFDADSHQRCGAEQKRTGAGREDDAGVREGHEHPREQRSGESAQALDRRGGAVRGDQLLGSPCQRGQQRLQSRPDESGGEPERRRERIHEQLGAGEERSG